MLTTVLILILILAYFSWRTWKCVKNRMYATQEFTWLIFVATMTVVVILQLTVAPSWTRIVRISISGGLVVAGIIASYIVNRRYNSWVDQVKESETDGEQK